LLRLDTTATPEYSKAFMMQKSKSYIRLGWDATNQKYTGKTEPVKWVRIHNLPSFVFQSLTARKCSWCRMSNMSRPVQEYEIQKQFALTMVGV
jgi:hypothetical protein